MGKFCQTSRIYLETGPNLGGSDEIQPLPVHLVRKEDHETINNLWIPKSSFYKNTLGGEIKQP